MYPLRHVGVLIEEQTRRSLECDWRFDSAAHEFPPDSAVLRGAGAGDRTCWITHKWLTWLCGSSRGIEWGDKWGRSS